MKFFLEVQKESKYTPSRKQAKQMLLIFALFLTIGLGQGFAVGCSYLESKGTWVSC
jgi:hypothetical protein